MGTITKIRQFSPYVFVVFAVLFITFMVLSDNIANLAEAGETPATATICEVNGEKIYYRDYEERVRIRMEQMRNDPQNEGREIDEQNVRNQVWDEMLREVLIKQAGRHLGINVSDEEILDILLENPPDYLKTSFTDNEGNFNRQLYLEIITNPEVLVNYLGQDPSQMDPQVRAKHIADFRNQLIIITDFLRQQKTNEAITSTLTAAHAISSPSFVEQKFINDNSSASLNLIYVGINTITDSIEVTDEEIREYYNKNKANFKTKHERKVKSLIFPVGPSAEDSARNNRRVELMKAEFENAQNLEQRDSIFSIKMNEYVGTESDWQLIQNVPPQISSLFANATVREVIGPIQMHDGTHYYRLDEKRSGGDQEVVKASHILISFNNNKDSARTFAQRIMRQANSNNFADLAREHSEDKGSGSQGGDLGYFGRGRMVPEFEKAAFDAKVGSIVGPVESQFGYHIIRVEDKRSEEIKYSTITFQTTTSAATRNNIKRDAFAAMKQIEAGENIDSLASKLEMQVIESNFLPKDRPFYGSMFLTNKIFEAKLNEVLEPREISNGNSVIVVQVSNIKRAGLNTLENETETIRQRLLKLKKLDLAGKRAEELYNLIKNNETLEGLEELPHNLRVANANIKNNGVIPGTATDFAATTHAFMLPTNKINAPVRGENGYFILEILSREIPTADKAENAQDFTRAQFVRTLFDTWFNKFKEDSEIKDFRSKYFSEF